jgi:hypothetical protein
LNTAFTVAAPVSVTVHVVPVALAQAPDHPPKTAAASGTAVRVTAAPEGKEAEHAVPQAMPPGTEETTPAAVPVFVTVSE